MRTLRFDVTGAARAALLLGMAGSVLAVPAAAQDRGADMIERLFEADANGDDALSGQEIRDQRAAMFDQLDTNADGILQEEERLVNQEGALDGAGERLRRRARGAGFGGGNALAGADADGDGQISRAEFVDATPRLFQFADSDGDGLVTRAEVDQIRQTMGGRRAGRGTPAQNADGASAPDAE